MKQKKGIKRLAVLMMLVASPFAYSQPISIFQEALPSVTPRLIYIEVKEAEPVIKAAKKIHAKKLMTKKAQKETRGIASWYSQADAFINKHTANGEIFNDQALTCASWYHSFGTRLKITNLKNGKSVICRVNDRGPNKRLNRAIDLSLGAFKKIADPSKGLIQVSIQRAE